MSVITFEPSLEAIDTAFTLAQRGSVSPASASVPPVVSLQDKLTDGALGAQVGSANENLIIWKDNGKESTRSRWEMDSEAAVDLGLAAIQTAMAAGTNVVLGSDGVVVP